MIKGVFLRVAKGSLSLRFCILLLFGVASTSSTYCAAVTPEAIVLGYVNDPRPSGQKEVVTGLGGLVPQIFQGGDLAFEFRVEPSFDRLRHALRTGDVDAAVMYYNPRLFSGLSAEGYSFYPRYFGKFQSFYYALADAGIDASDVKSMLAHYRLGMSRMPKTTALDLVGVEPDYLMFYAQHYSLAKALFRGRVDVMVAYPEVMSLLSEGLPRVKELKAIAPAFTLYLALGLSNRLSDSKRTILSQWADKRFETLPDVGTIENLPADPPWLRSAGS